MKIKIGITGQDGFIGKHLYNILSLQPDVYELVNFERQFFNDESLLDNFVNAVDVVFHLAAMNRHEDQQVIYYTNLELTETLIKSLSKKETTTQVLFSSSLQEEQDNLYGKSKVESRKKLEHWAAQHNSGCVGFVIPNVFGAFGKPFYNSFIATFCHLYTHGGSPEVHQDSEVPLIYVHNLVYKMIKHINPDSKKLEKISITEDGVFKVTHILELLKNFKISYFDNGMMPRLKSDFERDLFNTFRSYIDHKEYFPVKYTSHSDDRGSFTEVIRLEQDGQVSFSTTHPGITRGNHYHTRKIERFSVIKGRAIIEMRKIGTDEVLSFTLDEEHPGYVDMPIWYTHNIKNVGKEDLFTIFWINEFYDPNDADTYFENV